MNKLIKAENKLTMKDYIAPYIYAPSYHRNGRTTNDAECSNASNGDAETDVRPT